MKIRLMLGALFMMLTVFANGQVLTVPHIQSMNGQEFCKSFNFRSDRPHVCLTSESPLPLLKDTRISYTWIAVHPFGSFTWNTNSSERFIPIPWEGNYDVKLIIKYFRADRTRPYAAIRSNTVKLKGITCPEEEEQEQP